MGRLYYYDYSRKFYLVCSVLGALDCAGRR
jgi:hypothetical protein